jgi:ABC-type transport system involved in Fe-S cluster assembly fused permease/ATPase subunit
MIHDADEIVVLADGRIVEKGNHQDLLAQEGRYGALALDYDGGVL